MWSDRRIEQARTIRQNASHTNLSSPWQFYQIQYDQTFPHRWDNMKRQKLFTMDRSIDVLVASRQDRGHEMFGVKKLVD